MSDCPRCGNDPEDCDGDCEETGRFPAMTDRPPVSGEPHTPRERLEKFVWRIRTGLQPEEAIGLEVDQFAEDIEELLGWQAHDHGPSEGRGTACREYYLNGRPVGACKIIAATADRPPVSGEPSTEESEVDERLRLAVHAFFVEWDGDCVHFDKGFGLYRRCDDPDEGVPIRHFRSIEAEARATPPALDAHEAEYVDDGGDGYLACRCGYGHVLGDDALIDHIHAARLAEQEGERQ